ncbi:MAG: amidohydrolase family protein, partial [Deltaproteobacteria bacterium]|nr:amidohydrolase family protein [Deltaproteobacteria bacterium]
MKALRGIGISFLIAVGAAVVFLLWAEPDTVPNEVIFLGGDIVSMAGPSAAKALWIRNGRIEMLGSADEVRAAAGSSAKVVDLDGATVMPGFIEAHTHPLASALLGSAIDVSGFTHDSRAEIMETLS